MIILFVINELMMGLGAFDLVTENEKKSSSPSSRLKSSTKWGGPFA